MKVRRSDRPARPAGGARADPVSEAQHDYVRVLDSMSCGVMLIDEQGIVRSLNRMTAELLGLDRDEVVNRPFVETFIAEEAFEDFSETVLAAVYEHQVGHQRLVRVDVGGRSVPLSLATSYLRGDDEDPSSRLGVIAVISDMTELEALRSRETSLAQELQSKHDELRDAYRGLEERNTELNALLRKVQLARLTASGFVVALMVGLGAYLWQGSAPVAFAPGPGAVEASPEQWSFITVEPSPLSSSISVPTRLRPREEVVVTSPIAGAVAAVHVRPGQSVATGDALFELDASELRIQRRDAEVALLRAEAELAELRKWESGVEVSRARRSLSKSLMALEDGEAKLVHDRFLLGQGLVPERDVLATERSQRTRALDHEAARQDLESVLALGRQRLRVAELEEANARAELEKLDAVLADTVVTAPVAGVVLGDTSGSDLSIKVGASIEAGASLVTIGDVSGFTARGRVNEVDVRRLRVGQAVRVSGPAFPGVTLDGTVTHVSSEAATARGRRLPTFGLAADLELPDAPGRALVRLGMSANMRIVIYHKADALLVPAEAVNLAASPPTVRVDDGEGGLEVVPIEVGTTTLDSVEVLSGLSAGARVAVP